MFGRSLLGITAQVAQPTAFALTVPPLDNQVMQRSAGQTTGSVPIAGTYTGALSGGVEGQILKKSDNSIIVDWTNISATSAGGLWSGKIPGAPQSSNAYYVKARPIGFPGFTATSTNGFYMGAVFICYGQSNMGTFYGASSGSVTANATVFNFDGVSSWVAPNADGITTFLNTMSTTLGVPCGAVSGAIPATDINFLANNTPTDYPGGGGLWRYINNIFPVANISDGEMGLWFQGEGNANGFLTTSQYAAFFDGMHTVFLNQFGRTSAQFPMLVSGLGNYSGGDDGVNTDFNWQLIRATLFSLSNLSNTYFSHTMQDAPRSPGDTVHITAGGQFLGGQRFARTAKFVYGLGGAPAHFELTGGAVTDATHTRMALTLTGDATDLSSTSGITGFEVSGNNGATWVTATGARFDATHVDLTHASISTNSSRKVRYDYGELPDMTTPLRDNSALTLPATFTPAIISPTPSSVTPVPTWIQSSGISPFATGTLPSVPISNIAQQTVIIALRTANDGSDPIVQVTVTPNIGSPITKTTPIIRTGNCELWQFDLASSSVTSIDITITPQSNPGGAVYFATVYTVPQSSLSSLTPVDSKGVSPTGTITSASITNLTTSTDGFIIALAGEYNGNNSFGQGGAMTGTNVFANRVATATSPTLVSDASNTTSHTANCTVTATFDATSTTGIFLAAASWR